MAVNEEHRQAEIASELESLTRTLAHSTRTIPVPEDSYALLGDLQAVTDHMRQVCDQLAAWHDRAASPAAAADLRDAAVALDEASHAIAHAHAINGQIRWGPDRPIQ